MTQGSTTAKTTVANPNEIKDWTQKQILVAILEELGRHRILLKMLVEDADETLDTDTKHLEDLLDDEKAEEDTD